MLSLKPRLCSSFGWFPRTRGRLGRDRLAAVPSPDIGRNYTEEPESSLADGPSDDDDDGEPPWRLMGRTVQESDIIKELSHEQKLQLAVGAVADEMQTSEERVRACLDSLVTLVPDLKERVERNEVRPAVLARIAAAGAANVSLRIVRLKEIFPEGDVSRMCSLRLSLLVEPATSDTHAETETGSEAKPAVRWNNFNADTSVRGDRLDDIAEKADAWRTAMPADCRTDRMISDFPDLLNWSPDELLEEIRTRFANQNPSDVLRRNPHVAHMLERNKRDWDVRIIPSTREKNKRALPP